METMQITSLRKHLHLRKEKLDDAIKKSSEPHHLISLIKQVDTALEKLDQGSYGICEVCHTEIEEDRLLVDPLISVCLECMTDDQRRTLESDLEFASKIQRNLLPKNNQHINGWDFNYHYNPAGPVSGDFCDFIPLNDGSVLFLLGDVSGKGIPASLMMSHLYALIRTLLSFGLPVNEIVEKANRLFCESILYSNYATMVMGKVYPDGKLEICVAGHNPPLFISANDVEMIEGTGFPVGLFCESEYGSKIYNFEQGDTLLLYTDGLTEALRDEVEYGEKRIIELAKQHPDGESLLDKILNDHRDYLGDSRPGDDVTILQIKRNIRQ